ncbi:hypothetical protein GCM10027028_64030 [Streptomyces sundarbansensis]
MLAKVKVRLPVGRPRTKPGAVAADKAYSSRGNRSYLRKRGIKAVIPEMRDQAGSPRGTRPLTTWSPHGLERRQPSTFTLG